MYLIISLSGKKIQEIASELLTFAPIDNIGYMQYLYCPISLIMHDIEGRKEEITKKNISRLFKYFSMLKIIKCQEVILEKFYNCPKVHEDLHIAGIFNLSREYKYSFYCSLKDYSKHLRQFLSFGNI